MFRSPLRTAVTAALRDGVLILGLVALTPAAASAATQDSGQDATIDYQIVAQKLNEAANGLSPETGSSTYDINQQAIANLPQGGATPLNDVLLQAPGVAQDSYGQVHVRGDHGDLQYRINGIIIPEGITGFGQTLDTHFADGIELLTGALPAQYGYRTAGVVNITTKSGDIGKGGESSIMAGSNATLEGSQELYGSSGPASYYLTGTYDQNSRGLEPPTSGTNPLHDNTHQNKEFGYLSYLLNPETRVSLMLGNATNLFQIPDNPGQTQQFTLTGTPVYPSSQLNENQVEHNTYGIAALQGTIGDKTDYQFALFARNSSVLFSPDTKGDLIYNGIASIDNRQSAAEGMQSDWTYRLNPSHTLRAGFFASYENATSDSNSQVFSTTACGGLCTTPMTIVDNHAKDAMLGGVYLQDEWKATDKLTVNYGARFDAYRGYVSASQFEPRLGAVYEMMPKTTLHVGYARYFTPPPTELIAPEDIAKFANTTGAPPGTVSSPVVPEKDDYFDVGVLQKAAPGLQIGLDGYYKRARDLLDEGQFGQALIFSPFNYSKGFVEGLELTADYNRGPFTAYANAALSRAEGEGVASGQFNFDPTELTYIDSHFVHLDHDQLVSGSAGASYDFHKVKYSLDLLYGSGLRNGFANTGHLPFYTQVNAGVEHSFDLQRLGSVDAKLSVINLFDKVYEIRDGSGIGVFAPQYGPRRAFFVTLSKPF
jgi:outer membrane cobalamin receptor